MAPVAAEVIDAMRSDWELAKKQLLKAQTWQKQAYDQIHTTTFLKRYLSHPISMGRCLSRKVIVCIFALLTVGSRCHLQ
jgi:hypothetical protein